MSLEELYNTIVAYINAQIAEIKRTIKAEPADENKVILENFEKYQMKPYSGQKWLRHETFREFLRTLTYLLKSISINNLSTLWNLIPEDNGKSIIVADGELVLTSDPLTQTYVSSSDPFTTGKPVRNGDRWIYPNNPITIYERIHDVWINLNSGGGSGEFVFDGIIDCDSDYHTLWYIDCSTSTMIDENEYLIIDCKT